MLRQLQLSLALALLPVATASMAIASDTDMGSKLNTYIECTNRLSGRAYEARSRYLSWVGKSGPTGKEKVIYGTYTIYDTSDCRKSVAAANTAEPRDADIEGAASAFVAAVTALEPLLKETDDYYTQENYKDDKMAKGKALHPRLLAAWTDFEKADTQLSARIERLTDIRDAAEIAEIEKNEGRQASYHVAALMLKAKRLVRVEDAQPIDVAKLTEALAEYEAIVKATEEFSGANKGKIGSSFVGAAKAYLVTAKHHMRRSRDKVAYTQGEQMILRTGQGAWMVEGSPARVMRDYNMLIEAYNRGASF